MRASAHGTPLSYTHEPTGLPLPHLLVVTRDGRVVPAEQQLHNVSALFKYRLEHVHMRGHVHSFSMSSAYCLL
jgi:hypothetical protein